MLPSMGVDQDSPGKAYLMVPPPPPPSPADAADISKYKLSCLMCLDIDANMGTHLGSGWAFEDCSRSLGLPSLCTLEPPLNDVCSLTFLTADRVSDRRT